GKRLKKAVCKLGGKRSVQGMYSVLKLHGDRVEFCNVTLLAPEVRYVAFFISAPVMHPRAYLPYSISRNASQQFLSCSDYVVGEMIPANDSSKEPSESFAVNMASLADKAILSGAENRPPMLEKDMYDSWRSRMELYMLNKQHGRMILESVEHGPLLWHSVTKDGVTRLKKYCEMSSAEATQSDYDMLMQGTSLTKQERECKLYDAFDKFAYQKGETLRDFYLRFSLLLNDLNMYNMKLEQFQVNTKFLNTLPPEWSKFVTDVKLVRDLHTTNVDQLHAYLGQHEYHANEVRLMHERHSDPLALISQHQLNRPIYQHHQQSHHQP
nr:hypothetical protein [Tanacetum cinerariifolium]